MKRAVLLAVSLCVICCPAICGADGIGTLVAASKAMSASKQTLEQETSNFNRVKSAVDQGLIQKGQDRQAILSQYGEPVVKNEDFATNRERWVYKPAGSTFFNGARVALFFDRGGKLDEIVEAQ